MFLFFQVLLVLLVLRRYLRGGFFVCWSYIFLIVLQEFRVLLVKLGKIEMLREVLRLFEWRKLREGLVVL